MLSGGHHASGRSDAGSVGGERRSSGSVKNAAAMFQQQLNDKEANQARVWQRACVAFSLLSSLTHANNLASAARHPWQIRRPEKSSPTVVAKKSPRTPRPRTRRPRRRAPRRRACQQPPLGSAAPATRDARAAAGRDRARARIAELEAQLAAAGARAAPTTYEDEMSAASVARAVNDESGAPRCANGGPLTPAGNDDAIASSACVGRRVVGLQHLLGGARGSFGGSNPAPIQRLGDGAKENARRPGATGRVGVGSMC